MAEKTFVWLAPGGEARNGKRLETGQTYSIDTFGTEVVAEWVRTGAAKYPAPAKKGGEEK